jgi:hypothetical protein
MKAGHFILHNLELGTRNLPSHHAAAFLNGSSGTASHYPEEIWQRSPCPVCYVNCALCALTIEHDNDQVRQVLQR